ncbi:hypothetical protein L486_08350 [Kwoniella mangroviensis CBS 10435]|uniref:Uncharacterized protein n=1 Tax=Kwoniella mangroviensis CBS 10435 TaxID=1331196 RepID=A0A1B9IF27_9TREE|nr:hypothetical protein L486_08350 [Kwoniella mangroviensis CBS 10435]
MNHSSGPSSPRLILNSPPLESPSSTHGGGGTSYFQPSSTSSHPKPLYPPGQGSQVSSSSSPSRNKGKGRTRTPAEVYANQHTQSQNTSSKRQLPNITPDHHHHPLPPKEKEKEKTGKPIFEWISRKLGSRRATISESPSSPINGYNPKPNLSQLNESPKMANIGNGNGGTRNRLPSMPLPKGGTRGKPTRGRGNGLGMGMGGLGNRNVSADHSHHNPMVRQISNLSSSVDNQSLSMISISNSHVPTIERERRREANNPYPSIPIPKLIATGGLKDHLKRKNQNPNKNNNINIHQNNEGDDFDNDHDGTTISMSISYSHLSRSPRSRSYSLDSIRSDSRSSNSYSNRRSLDDNASASDNRIRKFKHGERGSTSCTNDRERDGPGSGSGLGIMPFDGIRPGADDDASLRPFPPSHPGSPTPSHSILSRTGSNPIPLTGNGGGRSRTNTFHSNWSGVGGSGGRERSFTSSSLDGLYGSTYRYSLDQYNDQYQDQDDDDGDEEEEGRGRQSRQDSTSTKPTTCISFDSTPPIAHIAQPQIYINTHPQTQVNTPHLAQAQTPIATQNGTFGLGDVITTSPMPTLERAQAKYENQDDPSSLSPSPRTHHLEASSSEENHTPPTPTTPTSNINTPSSPMRSPPPDVHVHVQAPKHTPHHPIHNPLPGEIPDDNASMLTLASSTFGLLPNQMTTSGSEGPTPTVPQGLTPTNVPSDPNTPQMTSTSTGVIQKPPSVNRLKDNTTNTVKRPSSITTPSIHWAPNTIGDERPTSTHVTEPNHNVAYAQSYTPSTHASILSINRNWTRDKVDRDASVRAVRRKGSWESYESGWSWRGFDQWNNTTGGNRASPIGERDRDRPASSYRSKENYSFRNSRNLNDEYAYDQSEVGDEGERVVGHGNGHGNGTGVVVVAN